jgi:hypothetical protein
MAEIDGGLMEGQTANGRPEVQGIAVGVAGEAAIALSRQMHRERVIGVGLAAGDWARATVLGVASPGRAKADQVQDLAHRDLLPEPVVVDAGHGGCDAA